MSNNYMYPTEKFKITLDLEVDVKFVGMWGGFGKEVLSKQYYEMLDNGDFHELLKEKILEDLSGETFDCSDSEPFDRLCFEVTESKGDLT